MELLFIVSFKAFVIGLLGTESGRAFLKSTLTTLIAIPLIPFMIPMLFVTAIVGVFDEIVRNKGQIGGRYGRGY